METRNAFHRLLLQGIGILRESDLIVRVEANRQTPLSIKRGETVRRARGRTTAQSAQGI